MNARRLWLLGASALAALVIVGVLIVVSQGGDDDEGGGGDGSGARANANEVRGLLDGIPQRGARLGDPAAPLRMVEFVDLQCPFCAEYARNVLPTIVRDYVRKGQLQLELRPLAFIGEDSRPAAAAAAAAAAQNRMWQFTDLFFHDQGTENSGYVTPAFLRGIARGADVDPEPVLAAARSQVTPPLLAQAAREAERLGVESTPSFFLGRRGQQLQPLQVSQLEPSEFTSQIDDALAR